MASKIIKKYSYAITHHPVRALLVIIAITIFAVIQAGNVSTKSMDNQDMIPDDLRVKKAFDIISDDFGGSDTAMISIELDKDYPGGINDIRNPEVIEYIHSLTILANEKQEVQEARSASTLLKFMNNGSLPNSKEKIKSMIAGSELFTNYISDDYSHAVVRLNLGSDYDATELAHQLRKLTNNVNKPSGLNAGPAGDVIAQPIVQEKLGPDMQRTSRFSMIGILAVLLILFGSIIYALTPLSVIVIGIIWAYGYFGFMGMKISSATSGAMSMIMGIGIDFGIQTVTRFRYELAKLPPEKAMAETLNKVFYPMLTTTIAALIGFRAMTMGSLSVMEDLGIMMSYGVTACFLAAITVVPVISVLVEKLRRSKK